MKQQEFIQMIEDWGVSLSELNIVVGRPCGWEGAHGVYEKDGVWIYYSSDRNGDLNEIAMSDEDEAFEKLAVMADVDLLSFTNKLITRDIAKMPKSRVCAYLTEKYSYTDTQAEEAWDYLKQDMNVLFAFKYYIESGKFVPEMHSYKVQGYSAETLYNTTYLEVIGAFNYLIYLRNKPAEALENLKKGLPRRRVFSEKATEELERKMETEKIISTEEETVIPEETTAASEETAEEKPEEAAEACEENGKTQEEILGKLEEILGAVSGLKRDFDDKIAEDTHKNGLFDNMHRELIKYQNGALDKIVDTFALDIIQQIDGVKKHHRTYENKEATEENYKKLLRIVSGIAQDLQDVLYRQNIDCYTNSGHEVDVRRQRIIETVPTNDPAKDNLIAFRVAEGYEKEGKVLRPERIKIFKYQPEAEKMMKNKN